MAEILPPSNARDFSAEQIASLDLETLACFVDEMEFEEDSFRISDKRLIFNQRLGIVPQLTMVNPGEYEFTQVDLDTWNE